MTLRSPVAAAAILLAGIAGMTGCEDAAKTAVVRAPVPNSNLAALEQGTSTVRPVAQPVAGKDNSTARLQLAPLPVFTPKRRSLLLLPPAQRGSKEDLIIRVEQKFASGEQNYRPGTWKRRAKTLMKPWTGCWKAATTSMGTRG